MTAARRLAAILAADVVGYRSGLFWGGGRRVLGRGGRADFKRIDAMLSIFGVSACR